MHSHPHAPRRPLVCVLESDTAMGRQYLVEPLDARFPKVNM